MVVALPLLGGVEPPAWQVARRVARAGTGKALAVSTAETAPMPEAGTGTTELLCLAHLPWDGVWQRPQQLLSRLAARWPVTYVCEPEIADVARPELVAVPAPPGVTAWQPVLPDREDVYARWREVYTDLVLQAAPASARTIAWFFTPTPLYVLPHLQPDLVVYDVMDDLSSFRGAADDLGDREAALLRAADLVLAGGRTLAASRRFERPDIHLLPSAVDAAHFRAGPTAAPPPPWLAPLPRPVLTWCGVIDERVDLDLVGEVADRRPDWSLVLAGPTAKISESDLPRRPNLHYPGRQEYDDLPAILHASDVCLMPFALNRATASISPTKTLEYLAAGRPVVSTPVPDVVADWTGTVEIVQDASEFVAAVERVLAEDPAQAASRRERAESAVRAREWSEVCRRIAELVEQQLARAAARPRG
jgi:UDP-galactopyranose mutase